MSEGRSLSRRPASRGDPGLAKRLLLLPLSIFLCGRQDPRAPGRGQHVVAEFGEEAGGPDPRLSKNHLSLAIVSSESEKSLYLWEKYSQKKKKENPTEKHIGFYL